MHTSPTPVIARHESLDTSEKQSPFVLSRITRTLSAISFSLLCLSAQAQTQQSGQIKIPIGTQNQTANIQLPTKHLSSDSVKQQFGEPVTIHPTIGNPPITRWDYPNFSVYFEYDHVIHAVKKP
jgi:hypothetical protein